MRSFFEHEFDRWNERQLAEALSPVQNKIGQVLSSPAVRNVLSQWRPSLDLEAVLAKQQILLVRVPKGELGADPANLLGSLLVAGLLQAAMHRPDPATRVPFHLYIDEFQNFTTDAFASILSEARKYALTLTIGHQYFDQLLPAVQAAILGNVGSLIAFRVGADDAAVLGNEFGTIGANVLRDLRRGEVVVQLTEDTEVSQCQRRSNIDGRTTRHAGYTASQKCRKRIEEIFGWLKTVAAWRKSRFRGLDRTAHGFHIALAAYNLARMPKLLIAEAG